ncbi:MAG: SMI1/KNR4 family protein [Bacteroidia bacterium]
MIPINSLIDIDSAIYYMKEMDWADYKELYEIDYDLGPKLFPFMMDGAGNFHWVDLNNGMENYGKVYWTNTFGESPTYLYNSLTDFFKAILQAYKTNVITIDPEGHLDCDYKTWGEICYKLDSTNKYWQEYAN